MDGAASCRMRVLWSWCLLGWVWVVWLGMAAVVWEDCDLQQGTLLDRQICYS